MKKLTRLLIIMILSILILSACQNKEVLNKSDVKDVTMLLRGIGGELSTLQSLGDLPEPQVSGQKYFYDTKEIEGYFSGYNIRIELADDNEIVTSIYLEPYDGNNIKVNGFIIGCDIEETNDLFGEVKFLYD